MNYQRDLTWNSISSESISPQKNIKIMYLYIKSGIKDKFWLGEYKINVPELTGARSLTIRTVG